MHVPETDTAQHEDGPLDRLRLAEELRATHQRLLGIARSLGALGEELDRALGEGRAAKAPGSVVDDPGSQPAG